MRVSEALSPKVRDLIGSDAGKLERLQATLGRRVKFDEYGLVRPTERLRNLRDVIVPDLHEARHRMQEVLMEGRTVIYFPGAFDLVHLGHASYVQEGIDHVCRVTSLKRDQLFVVILADSDSLIEAAKPAHRYATEGNHPRPIENAALFAHVLAGTGGFNPRLIDLAQLDVDMVGMLPSPIEAHELLGTWSFRRWFKRSGSFRETPVLLGLDPGSPMSGEAHTALAEYETLIAGIGNDGYRDVLEGFNRARYGMSSAETSHWSLASWQLLLHRFLGMVHQHPNAGCFRVLSVHDSYSAIVRHLMGISKIQTTAVDDTHLVSTTDLIKTFGWETLYRAKAQAFDNWVRKIPAG